MQELIESISGSTTEAYWLNIIYLAGGENYLRFDLINSAP